MELNNFDYTEEMHVEDRKLVLFWAHKWLKLYPYMQHQEDELISFLFEKCYTLRLKYNEDIGVKYGTYILENFKYCCLTFMAKYKKDKNNTNLSLDASLVEDDEDFNFYDTLAGSNANNEDFENVIDYEILKKYIDETLTRFKPKQIKIITEYISDQNFRVTAEKNNVTRQYVEILMQKFRVYLKETLINNKILNDSYFNKFNRLESKTSTNTKVSELAKKYNLTTKIISRLKQTWKVSPRKDMTFETYIERYIQKKEKQKHLTKCKLIE